MSYAKFLSRFLLLLSFAFVLAGCGEEAIWVSRTELNFERDTNPQFLEVANSNSDLGTITVTISPDVSWIRVTPTVIPCKPPTQAGLVKERVEVRIDRTKITSTGENTGVITFSAKKAASVDVEVSVIQDSLQLPMDPLNIVNPVTTYSIPYLVEFAFALRDQNDRAITGEPAQFTLSAFEDDIPMGRPQGLLLRRGAARQLWIELVMDYSVFMHEIEGAIPEMERAATEVLLPSLNEDVLVAVSAFYRDNLDSRLIVPYTVDRQHVANRIKAIQSEYLTGWASGARVYDALMSSIQRFGEINMGERDDKYIVLFCNGRDTSSTTPPKQVSDAAKAQGVRIIAVGFGDSIDANDLNNLALAANGRYISASSLDDLPAAFSRIIEDLNGQYIVRWASARRDSVAVQPSIQLSYGSASASHHSSKTFKAANFSGDPLQGELILIQSETPGNTTVFLRANYVPYDISRFQLRAGSAYPFRTSVVSPADDGLLAGWQLSITDESEGTKLITVNGSNAPMPFASFGAMLRFDFDEAVDTPFTAFEVDNTLYSEGQSFIIR